MLAAYNLQLSSYLSFSSLKQYRDDLKDFVEKAPLLAPIIYIAVYIAVVALSIPGAIFLTLLGGFIFDQPFSSLYTVFAASTGAFVVFSIAKYAFEEHLEKKVAPYLQNIKKGMHENGVYYLLFLRLVPLFPFWLVNLAPAFLNVRNSTFYWTSLLGILPGSIVFCQIGSGLDAIFESGQEPTLQSILNPEMKIALICLGLFALMPVVLKNLKSSCEK